MNKMKLTDVAYMAGIFDGEGWFTISKSGGPRASIAMTDFDIIERLHDRAGIGNINFRPAKKNKKAQKSWVINVHEDVEDFINAILPFLGQRRSNKAIDVLDDIRSRRERREWREIYFICGHEKTEENTYHFKSKDRTACITCQKKPRKKA